jgi:hypothetical protein
MPSLAFRVVDLQAALATLVDTVVRRRARGGPG